VSVVDGGKALAKTGKPIPAALGFRVKSGWAMAVLLAGSSSAPKLVRCQAILLSDPKIPQSKQPYHAALELPGKEGELAARKLRDVVRGAAKKSVGTLLKEAVALQYGVRGAALVVGSLVDPATLHNEHIRAHGLEGQLFRTVLEDAFRARKILCEAFLKQDAYETAAGMLRRTPAQIKRAVAALGESHEGSWRAEEKLAALAAWVALAKSMNQPRSDHDTL
jgi:hypothetical protein